MSANLHSKTTFIGLSGRIIILHINEEDTNWLLRTGYIKLFPESHMFLMDDENTITNKQKQKLQELGYDLNKDNIKPF